MSFICGAHCEGAAMNLYSLVVERFEVQLHVHLGRPNRGELMVVERDGGLEMVSSTIQKPLSST
jgi:hypothetical protein